MSVTESEQFAQQSYDYAARRIVQLEAELVGLDRVLKGSAPNREAYERRLDSVRSDLQRHYRDLTVWGASIEAMRESDERERSKAERSSALARVA